MNGLRHEIERLEKKEGMLESLDGISYTPIIIDGRYVCPKCKKEHNIEPRLIPLNPKNGDSDYLYFRCTQCRTDYRMKNKEDKDFKFTI